MVRRWTHEADGMLFIVAVIIGIVLAILELYGGAVGFAFIAGGAAWRWSRRRRKETPAA
jgi:membrane protein implicated in regulation of membrane protease activity